MQRIQYAPRSGATYEPSLDILVPALVRLRGCRDSMDVLVLIETSLPDMILPALAWAASQKRYIAEDVVATLVRACGPLFLERCLGKARARQLTGRYPKRTAVLSGVA